MEPKVNFTIVGVFVIALGAAFVVFFLWLSTLQHSKSYNTYLVYVKEDVTGLAQDTAVRFNGVPVGTIRNIELDPSNPQLVRLTLAIQAGTPITISTIASLQFQGITGLLYVGLQAKTIAAPLLKALPGEKYPVIPYRPSFIIQLSEVLPELASSVASIGDRMSKLFNDQNQKSFQNSLKNIAVFTKMLSDNSDKLSQTIQSLQAASKDLPDIFDQLKVTLNSATKASNQIQIAARKMGLTMTSGNIVIQDFSNQLLPSTHQLINQLNQVSANFKQITDQIKQNPSILVRGSAPPSRGPGE